MIRKDELSKAIREYFKSLIDEKADRWAVVDINASIQKIIAELDANPWNLVEELVPSDERYVLLSFENFSTPLVGRYEEDEEGGAFFVDDNDVSCSSEGLFVNARMELPKPHRAEESDS